MKGETCSKESMNEGGGTIVSEICISIRSKFELKTRTVFLLLLIDFIIY